MLSLNNSAVNYILVDRRTSFSIQFPPPPSISIQFLINYICLNIQVMFTPHIRKSYHRGIFFMCLLNSKVATREEEDVGKLFHFTFKTYFDDFPILLKNCLKTCLFVSSYSQGAEYWNT